MSTKLPPVSTTRVITAFTAPAPHRPVAPWKRISREIIRRSDSLICYHYPDLRESGLFDLCGFARRRPALQVLDVADEETARFIHASIARLLPKQQAIIHALDAGESYRCIGEVYHVSGSAVFAADARARRLLRKYALERLHNMPPPAKPHSFRLTAPLFSAIIKSAAIGSLNDTWEQKGIW